MFKIIRRYFRNRWIRFYFKSHWHLVLDLTLIITIVCLAITVIVLFLYKPNLSSFGSDVRPGVDLNNPPLNLEITADEKAVGAGEGVPVKIIFNNSGAAEISNLTISLEMSDDNFILKKIEKAADNSGFTVSGQSLNFAAIAAGAGGEAEVKVYFAAKGASRSINWRARSEYNWDNQVLKHDFYLPSLKTKAEIAVQGAAYYTSPQGDQLGIGPLPPLVGIPTNYWVFWEVQSSADWKNLVISARLPKGVELTDSRSLLAGEFNYNPETRQLIWKVPEFSGREESYHLGFEIQLLPTADQIGEVPVLLGDAKYYATDVLTGEEADGVLEKLTANLDKDRFNSGNGKVVGE